jgi:hypothetical protein
MKNPTTLESDGAFSIRYKSYLANTTTPRAIPALTP